MIMPVILPGASRIYGDDNNDTKIESSFINSWLSALRCVHKCMEKVARWIFAEGSKALFN